MKFLRHAELKDIETERNFKDNTEKQRHFDVIPEEERYKMLSNLQDSLGSIEHDL